MLKPMLGHGCVHDFHVHAEFVIGNAITHIAMPPVVHDGIGHIKLQMECMLVDDAEWVP